MDLADGVIRVSRSHDANQTKGGHDDYVPIADALRPILAAAIAASPSELVFPHDDGTMQRHDAKLVLILARALARAGIVHGYEHRCRRKACGYAVRMTHDDVGRCPKCNYKLWPKALVRKVRFHDLRHTTATLLLKESVPYATVQRILRHSDPKTTTEIYGHLELSDMLAAVNRFRFALPESVTPKALPETTVVTVMPSVASTHGNGTSLPVPRLTLRDLVRPYLSARQVAERLGVCTATVFKICGRGELPHVRISNAVRIAPEDLDAYLAVKRARSGVAGSHDVRLAIAGS